MLHVYDTLVRPLKWSCFFLFLFCFVFFFLQKRATVIQSRKIRTQKYCVTVAILCVALHSVPELKGGVTWHIGIHCWLRRRDLDHSRPTEHPLGKQLLPSATVKQTESYWLAFGYILFSWIPSWMDLSANIWGRYLSYCYELALPIIKGGRLSYYSSPVSYKKIHSFPNCKMLLMTCKARTRPRKVPNHCRFSEAFKNFSCTRAANNFSFLKGHIPDQVSI